LSGKATYPDLTFARYNVRDDDSPDTNDSLAQGLAALIAYDIMQIK